MGSVAMEGLANGEVLEVEQEAGEEAGPRLEDEGAIGPTTCRQDPTHSCTSVSVLLYCPPVLHAAPGHDGDEGADRVEHQRRRRHAVGARTPGGAALHSAVVHCTLQVSSLTQEIEQRRVDCARMKRHRALTVCPSLEFYQGDLLLRG